MAIPLKHCNVPTRHDMTGDRHAPATDDQVLGAGSTGSERQLPVYDSLTYREFLERHSRPNTPFLLSPSATESWSARHDWVHTLPDGSQVPNLDGLRGYGHHIVPVADTLRPEYSEFRRTDRPLAEVLDLWTTGAQEGEGLYVKDWHLFAETKGQDAVYDVPECFRDDWLNPPPPSPTSTSTIPTPASTSDFRFTYLGPSGTYTPLHRDVYSSYSWSANIVGRKLWWLFPPTPEVLKRIIVRGDIDEGEPVFDVRELEDEGGGIKVVQLPGEVIWVPSGWYHQVLNLDFCISINHNFFCSPTLPRIWAALCDSQRRVERSIADVRDMIIQRLGAGVKAEREWTMEVQGLLERDAGWGWRGFWHCVLLNVQSPPLLSAAAEMRAPVREVIERYKTRPEWGMLDEVRGTVDQIERLLNSSADADAGADAQS